MSLHARRRLGLGLLTLAALGYASLWCVTDTASFETGFIFYATPIIGAAGWGLVTDKEERGTPDGR